MLKSSRQVIAKFLPREHGAFIVWLSSLIVSIFSVGGFLYPDRLFLFIVSSIGLLGIVSLAGRRSIKLIRIERHLLLLLILSGSLTLIVPFGFYLLANHLSTRAIAIWFLFVTYTSLGVIISRRSVRNISLNEKKSITIIAIFGLFIIIFQNLFFVLLDLIDFTIMFSPLPLLVSWFFGVKIGEFQPDLQISKIGMIRRIGFLQTGNLLAFSVILVFSSIL